MSRSAFASRNPGVGQKSGAVFPARPAEFSLTEIDEMLKLDFVTRSRRSSRRLLVMKSRRKSWKSATRGVCLPGSGRQC